MKLTFYLPTIVVAMAILVSAVTAKNEDPVAEPALQQQNRRKGRRGQVGDGTNHLVRGGGGAHDNQGRQLKSGKGGGVSSIRLLLLQS